MGAGTRGRAVPVLIASVILTGAIAPLAVGTGTSLPGSHPVASALLTRALADPGGGRAGPPLSGANNSTLNCDGVLWSSSIWASYSPSYCYGHDEPTLSYLSSAPGSGANASFRIVLPSDDGSTYAQGQFFATLWFGGVVHDANSTAGNLQAFLEFQFYPAPPVYTGPGSGASDCLPNGAYAPNPTPGSNEWFACAIVWQLQRNGSSAVENAAFAGPLDAAGSSGAILVMHSGDSIFVNYSGIAQSTTQGWQLSAADTATGQSGSVTLVSGSLVLSPYYSTATASSTLSWGASNPGAVAFAYEIGHDVSGTTCSPSLSTPCDSYGPGGWPLLGPLELSLPLLGGPAGPSYPSTIGFSSSAGGEAEVNASSCGTPSFSPSSYCMYPFYQYRGGSYSFTFGAAVLANATHVYGGEYQFPAAHNAQGQFATRVEPAPWGTVGATVSPTNATVEFNPKGATSPLVVAPNGTAGGEFAEGPYWLNVSAAGCTNVSRFLYLATGAVDRLSVTLSCGPPAPLAASASATPSSGDAPLAVTFAGTASGGRPPYSYAWTFGDGAAGSGANLTHTYTAPGAYEANLTVTDAGANVTTASVAVTVAAPLTVLATATPGSGPAPLTVRFTGATTGGIPPVSFLWAFGDGGSSTAQDPTHTYAAAGRYVAIVRAVDASRATTSSSVTVVVTSATAFSVYFNETGLAGGTRWNVSVDGLTESTTLSRLQFALPNGSYAYSIGVGNSSFRPTASHGNVSVVGASVSVPVAFVPVAYPVTFLETTLPGGLAWSVRFDSVNRSTATGALAFSVGNGSYAYAIGPPSGYVAVPSSGLLTVAGAGANLTIAFSTSVGSVAFEASGLPTGAPWSVSLGTSTANSTGRFANFTVTIGTYPFAVTPPPGYSSAPVRGNVTVTTVSEVVPVAFAPVLYAVTFQESGLGSHTTWSVTVGGRPYSSNSSAIVVELADGSYPYAVANVSGYSVANGSGVLSVAGQPVREPVRFVPVATPSPIAFLTSSPFLLGLFAVGLIAAGGILYAVGARRRREDRPPPRTPGR